MIMPSIRDVAKKAGVGIGTVSRTLNGSGYVSEETRKKIYSIMEEMNYNPGSTLRTSSGRKTGLVGVIVPSLEHPFFARMMRCIEFELSRHDYKCIACNTIDIMNRQIEFMDMLEKKAVDGLIACVDPVPGFAGRNGKAIVSMDRYWSGDVPLIRSDHEQGGRTAAEIFLRDGCRKVIQFYGGLDRKKSANIRHEVMEQVLRENGCEVISVNMEWDAMSYAYNKNIILKYWDIIRDTDGCMTNDIGALSCLAVARKMGLAIPEQFKIIGYDGTEITNLTYPELSVVEQDCPALAKECVDAVLQLIQNKEPESMLRIVPIHWRERGTT